MNESTGSHEHAGRRAVRNFALIFSLRAAGTVVAGYAYYWHFAQHYRAKVDQNLTTIGDQKVRELVAFRRERLADASVLYQNAAFSTLVRRFLDKPTDADTRHQLDAWMENNHHSGEYDVVRLLDSQGVTRLSSPTGLPPVSSVVMQRISEILRAGQVTFLDFHRNEYDQRVYLDLLIPVLDQRRPSRPLGLLYLRIDPTVEFYPALVRWPIPSATAESELVRRDGNAVLYLSELRTRKGTLLTERVPLTDTARTAVMAVLGRQGIVHGVDKPGNPVVGYVRPVPDSPWFVVLREEEAEAYAPVREQLWLTIGLVAALLVGLAVGFMALWRGERVRFYRNREKAAEALRLSEERYQRLFESNPYPAMVYDLETLSFLAVNPAAIRHYGYSRDEFLAMTIKDIRPAEDLARLVESVAAPRNSLSDAGVWRHYRKDGTLIDVEITSNTLMHDGRRAVLVIPIDITERKRAAEERERLVASLQQALADVKTLSGLLPICSYCKKIRDDGNFWHNVDSYMTEHSEITFSHGMCPDCLRKHHPEFADEVLNRG